MKYVGYFTLALIHLLLTALVVTQLWTWFVVPLGVQQIGMAHAFGLNVIVVALVVSRLRGPTFAEGIVQKKGFGEILAQGFLMNGMTLLVGYITHLLM